MWETYDGIPNCVPEYYREIREREEREWEKRDMLMGWYERNKKHNAELIKESVRAWVLPSERCYGCQFSTELLPESEEDDMPTIVCRKRLCRTYTWDCIRTMILSPYYSVKYRLKLFTKRWEKKEPLDDFD